MKTIYFACGERVSMAKRGTYVIATEAEEELKLISDSYEANKQGWEAEIAALRDQIENPKMTYCAFCGEQYDIEDREKAIELITEHVQVCPKHPIAAMRERQRVLVDILKEMGRYLQNKYKNYPPGSPELTFARAALVQVKGGNDEIA